MGKEIMKKSHSKWYYAEVNYIKTKRDKMYSKYSSHATYIQYVCL